MGLDFGVNCYRGISDACPEVKFLTYDRCFPEVAFLPNDRCFNACYLCGIPENDQIFIIAIASGTIFDEEVYVTTRNEEHVVFKLNCRENLTMSATPEALFVKEWEEEVIGDFATIKFIETPSTHLQTCYIAVCEGLMLRKFLVSFVGVNSFVLCLEICILSLF